MLCDDMVRTLQCIAYFKVICANICEHDMSQLCSSCHGTLVINLSVSSSDVFVRLNKVVRVRHILGM